MDNTSQSVPPKTPPGMTINHKVNATIRSNEETSYVNFLSVRCVASSCSGVCFYHKKKEKKQYIRFNKHQQKKKKESGTKFIDKMIQSIIPLTEMLQ